MEIFDLDQALIERYESFARSFSGIHAPEIRAQIDAAIVAHGMLVEVIDKAAGVSVIRTRLVDFRPVLAEHLYEVMLAGKRKLIERFGREQPTIAASRLH